MGKSAALLGKNIPFVEAAHYDGRQRPSAVLLRTSWTTGDKGAANGIAQAWHNPNSRVDSCHYVIDEFQTLRCVPDNIDAYHSTLSHKGAVSINVCHNPPFAPERVIVCRAAQLTARLCKLYHIPVRILSDAEEAKWVKRKWRSRGGIILKTVGDFPADEFFDSVVSEYRSF